MFFAIYSGKYEKRLTVKKNSLSTMFFAIYSDKLLKVVSVDSDFL